ncbi:hypothetical protein CC80DRAFT_549820 [Byssothecium circinans]|uniref:Uncharacterized protein n=1 Tax=Byssothecium circinans TaxID=147558 RepID=A0A6A5TWN2_9PLEO|nr:hypothetical protein CC80DRAFT_549820 [Byssothecium circinans]
MELFQYTFPGVALAAASCYAKPVTKGPKDSYVTPDISPSNVANTAGPSAPKRSVTPETHECGGDDPGLVDQCRSLCANEPKGDGWVQKSVACIINIGKSPWLGGLSEEPPDKLGHRIRPGDCSCNNPVTEVLDEFFMESIKAVGDVLQQYLCPQELGFSGTCNCYYVVAAIQTVKAYKYAYEAKDAAIEFANAFLGGLSASEAAGCRSPPSFDDPVKVFVPLSDAPDEIIPEESMWGTRSLVVFADGRDARLA